MARSRDNTKRDAILLASKRLFAHQGYDKTSISDIRRETGLPVGTIYTYFAGKDEILTAIVDNGWEDLKLRVVTAFADAPDLEKKIDLVVDRFIPELIRDSELINILLTEAAELTQLGEKLDLLIQLTQDLQFGGGFALIPADNPETRPRLRAAIAVYFTGILMAARVARDYDVGFDVRDIQEAIRATILRDVQQRS